MRAKDRNSSYRIEHRFDMNDSTFGLIAIDPPCRAYDFQRPFVIQSNGVPKAVEEYEVFGEKLRWMNPGPSPAHGWVLRDDYNDYALEYGQSHLQDIFKTGAVLSSVYASCSPLI